MGSTKLDVTYLQTKNFDETDISKTIQEEQTSFSDQNINSAKNHIKIIEHIIDESKNQLKEYRRIIHEFKTDNLKMKSFLQRYIDPITGEVQPGIDRKETYLHQQIKEQDTINEDLRRQITEIEQDKRELINNMVKSKQIVDKLEKKMGNYRMVTEAR